MNRKKAIGYITAFSFVLLVVCQYSTAGPHPSNASDFSKLIVKLVRNKHNEEALLKINEFLSYWGEYGGGPVAWGNNVKGILLKDMKLYKGAIECYKIADKESEDDKFRAHVNSNIGNLYSAMGKYSEALTYFEKAIKLFPDNEEIFKLKMAYFVYLPMGKMKEAEEIYLSLLPELKTLDTFTLSETDKGHATCVSSVIALQLNKKKDAIDLCRLCIERITKFSYDMICLGCAQQVATLGYMEEADKYYKLANKENVTPAALALYFHLRGDDHKAEEYLKKSFEEMKSDEARKNWRQDLQLDTRYPVDSWETARDKPWFKKFLE